MDKLIYTEEELPQRSDQWHEIRKTSIGASEISTVLGLMVKYEKPITLWKRKTGKLKPKVNNAQMQKGADLEDEARQEIQKYLISKENINDPELIPYFAIHPKYEFITSSFDGVDLTNKFITEIKCPSYPQVFKYVIENGIQNYYYPQVQQQLAIANEHWKIKDAYFGSYYPEGVYIVDYSDFKEYSRKLAVVSIKLDKKYCKAMFKVAEKFNDCIKYDYWDEKEYQEVLDNFNKEVCKQQI